jgi:hypothetical protein
MSGLEAFDALHAVTGALPFRSACEINPIDACDLGKLTPQMLISRGFAEKYAEEVSSALLAGDVSVLGTCLGLRLRKQRWAPRLA